MKNTTLKSFSIVTAAHNSSAFIHNCIESIINSNYDLNKIEHVIIDDGSVDNTKSIVLKYISKYPHIKYVYKQNGNWGSVINYVIDHRLVNNDYVCILDSDDRIHPQTFQRANKLLNDDTDCVVGSIYWWNGKRTTLYTSSNLFLFKKKYTKKLPYTVSVLPATFIIKQNIFYKSMHLLENVPHQDTILLASYFNNIKSIKYTHYPFVYYWSTRVGNTMVDIKDDKNILIHLANYKKLSEMNMPHFYVWSLLSWKHMRRYMKQNQIKIHFNVKLSFKWMPIWAKPFFWLAYLLIIKHYFTFADSKPTKP